MELTQLDASGFHQAERTQDIEFIVEEGYLLKLVAKTYVHKVRHVWSRERAVSASALLAKVQGS